MTLTINHRELKDEDKGPIDLAYALMSRAKLNVMSDKFTKKIVVSSRDGHDLLDAINIAEEFIL